MDETDCYGINTVFAISDITSPRSEPSDRKPIDEIDYYSINTVLQNSTIAAGCNHTARSRSHPSFFALTATK